MKKTLLLSFIVCFMVTTYSHSNETRTIQEYKIEKPSEYYADIISVHCGPFLSESDFKKLELDEEFYTAYYRVVLSRAEISTAAAVELIGLYGESVGEVINAYTFTNFLNPFHKFIGWENPKEFSFFSGHGTISVTIQENGKFILNIQDPQPDNAGDRKSGNTLLNSQD